MGIDSSVSVVGFDDFLTLSSPSPEQFLQIIGNDNNNQQQNCFWQDFSAFVKPPLHHSTWKNVTCARDETKRKFPKQDDMKYWILAAVAFIFIRVVVERYAFQPLGKRLGIKHKKSVSQIPCSNPSAVNSLETAYHSRKNLGHLHLQKLSTETGLKEREIQRWMRKRRNIDKPSTLVKFSESGWRFTAYVLSTILGVAVLWDKPWFWDYEKFWTDYPNQEIPNEIWWYHLYGGGLYLSFLFTQFVDVKRKDFWEMLLHHVITIGLLTYSFTFNVTRIGMVTLLLHDCADIFIESAKMANYAKKENLATSIFVVFTLVWIVTRLVIFPFKIIDSAYQNAFRLMSTRAAYSIVGMLFMLLGLHLFWTYFICKVAISAVTLGPEKGTKDSRSSSESSSSDSESEEKQNDNVASYQNPNLANKRFSLQYEYIYTKQRAIMKRISVEIM